jgi:hypothetical protein
MEDRNVALYSLEAQKNQALAQMTQAERLAMEGFKVQREGHAVTRAGQFNLDRDFLNIETQKGIEDYRAKNNGKDPVGQELANIRSTAVTKVAEMRRMPFGGPTGLDIRTQSEITDRIGKDPILKPLEDTLGIARLKPNNEAQIAELQAQIDARRQVIMNEVIRGVKSTPGGGTTTPPPAAGGFTVTAPNGRQYNFPTKEQADAFKAQIGG